MITNYGELKAFLADVGNRADLTSKIPNYVQQAEEMIARQCRAVEMVTSATLDETDRDAGAVYNLPTNFLEKRSVYGTRAGRPYQLKATSLAQLRTLPAGTPPVWYAIYGNQIEFSGNPAAGSEFELIYFARPTAFADDADTNALLTNHSALYVNAALHWLHIKTQDLELAQGHAASFTHTVETLNELANRTRGGAGTAPGFNYSSGSAM